MVDQADTAPWTPYRTRQLYTTIQRLIAIMADPGGSFTTDTLDYAFTGTGADGLLHHRLFQKRSGLFYLMVTHDGVSWKRSAPVGDLDPAVSVNLVFSDGAKSLRADLDAAHLRLGDDGRRGHVERGAGCSRPSDDRGDHAVTRDEFITGYMERSRLDPAYRTEDGFYRYLDCRHGEPCRAIVVRRIVKAGQ